MYLRFSLSGKITLGDLLEIMPFDDPVVCLEVCAAGVRDCVQD